jgi:hypothetical protein
VRQGPHDAAETVVFLGPSLAVDTARDHLAAAYAPPVRRGDLARHVAAGAKRLAIVDGEFAQSLSVSIVEIREALAAGVEVWGASSMGALRAAECHVLGMRGVGWIYEEYRTGALQADDEVALMLDPETLAPLTVPLVNVRWALACAVAEAVVDGAEAAGLFELARSLPFDRRTYRGVVALARLGGPARAASAFADFVHRQPHLTDRKRLDALGLLDALHRSANDRTEEEP